MDTFNQWIMGDVSFIIRWYKILPSHSDSTPFTSLSQNTLFFPQGRESTIGWTYSAEYSKQRNIVDI